jgi:hypothetical protein
MKSHKKFLILLVAAITLFSSLAWGLPAARADAGPVRIHFAHGATSAVVSGDLKANSSIRYILQAGAGQLMDAILSAPEGVTLKVTTRGGRALKPVEGTSGPTAFRGYLPYSADYILTVTSGSAAASYSLEVSIPIRVRLDHGTTSKTLASHLDAQQSLDYILHAAKDQVLEINATPKDSAAPLQLILYGVDGTVLMSGMAEGSTFKGVLPLTEDYIATVRAGDSATDFTLEVIIPQTIRFRSGASSASVHTQLRKDHTQYYALSGKEGQTLRVDLKPDKNLTLTVTGLDGTVLKSNPGEASAFLAKLPLTQDYILAVHAARTSSYTLKVTIN